MVLRIDPDGKIVLIKPKSKTQKSKKVKKPQGTKKPEVKNR